jgi:L-tartrate/succinate antiporter
MKLPSFKAILPVLIGLLIWVLPVPDGLTVEAWRYFAIFVGVVAALILEPIPAAAAGFIGVTLAAALLLVPTPAPQPPAKPAEPAKAAAPAPTAPDKPAAEAAKPAAETVKPAAPAAAAAPTQTAAATAEPGKTPAAPAAAPAKPAEEPKPAPKIKPGDVVRWALSGFSNGTVWLIFIAFMFAMGYERTRLGKRIALLLVKGLGKKTLGLGYAVAFADLILAPFTPSNTARSGGTIFPIIENIPPLYGSSPDNEPRKIGGYLMWTALATTCVTSSTFITALAPNLLALELTAKTAKLTFDWMEWFKSFLPVGLILFAITPYLTYKFYPPTLKASAEVSEWAAAELAKMGRMSGKE